MTTVTFRVGRKGSSKSGNYGHAGRPGKVGGSASKHAIIGESHSDVASSWQIKFDDMNEAKQYAKGSKFQLDGHPADGATVMERVGKTLYVTKRHDNPEPKQAAQQPEAFQPSEGGVTSLSSPLTDDEKFAIQQYKALGHDTTIGKHLRGQITPIPEVQKEVSVIDGAMAKSVLSNDMTLHRGLSFVANDFTRPAIKGPNVNIPARNIKAEPDPFKDLKVGDTYVDKGFQSTSPKQDIAQYFATKYASRPDKAKGETYNQYRLVISAPAGLHAIDLNKTTGTHGIGALTSQEADILLDRGLTMLVNKIEHDGGVSVLHVSVANAKEMIIHYRYKGSSKSGNYGHAGIPGHLGGSAPKAVAPVDDRQWKKFGLADDHEMRLFLKQVWPAREGVGVVGTEYERYHAYVGYTGMEYVLINGMLRGNVTMPAGNPNAERATKRNIKLMDELMKNSTVPENVISYRGAHLPNTVARWDSIKPGDTFVDKGFVSTSLNKSKADVFAGRYNNMPIENSVLLTIRVPKGSHAIGMVGEEAELTLDRGSKFRVISTTKEHVIPDIPKDSLGKPLWKQDPYDAYNMEVELIQ